MKLILENWKEFLVEENDELSEMATAWKERGLAGPYKLKSGEMGDTLAALQQYVTPEGELPTYFIHFGGITEQDVTAVKKKFKGAANTYIDKKVGPARSVTAPNRQSKHGPQFKFGVNPRADAKFNTPYGIYAYPLTPSIFRSLSEGTLPFAQNEPFILLFKSTDRAPLIYTSQDIPDDEYREYVERLFSDEMVESERKVRYDRANRKRAKSPAYGNSYAYYPPLDFLRKANQQWQTAAEEAWGLAPADADDPGSPGSRGLPHPRDLPIVRQTEHETDQHMTAAGQGSYTETNSAYLWGLVRAAAHEDPIRWNMMMRKLGIGGIVDDLGTGHIHPQEPVQAVFFTKRDPEQNLELVEVLPNTHTKAKIERRSDQAQQREIRDLVKSIIAKVHPDPKFKVTQEFITNLISYVGLRDDDWLFNPSTKTDLRETIISLKEEGLQIITEYIIHSYANGTLMELSNAKIEWHRNMRKLGFLLVQLDSDNHPTTAFHYKALKKLRADHKDFRMTPSLSQGVENGEYSARDLAQGSFDEIDKIQQEHAEVLRASYEEALQAPGEAAAKPPTRAPEDPPVEDLSSLFENGRRCLKEGELSDAVGKSAAARVRRIMQLPAGVTASGRLDPEESEESEEPSEPEEHIPLADDPIVRHNLRMLDTLGGPPATDRFAFPTSEEDMMSLVGSIPALRTSKIVKSVGSGTKKIAYKLDNDHIFSLFQSGYGGDQYSDLGWYAGIQDRQFKGESSIDEPAIHDFGEVPILPKMRHRPNVLKYVEMSGIVPLSDGGPPSLGAMAEFDLVRLDFDIVQIAKFVEASLYHGMLIKDPISLDKKVRLVQHWWRNKKGLPFAEEEDILDIEVKALSPDLTMNLIKTLVRLAVRLKTTHVLQDIHPGNLGMSIENPDEFVVIDI